MHDEYRNSVWKYYGRMGIYVVPALVLGYLTDEISGIIQSRFKLRPAVMVAIQLILIIYVMYIVEKLLSNRYADDWRGKTPSLLFFGAYFILQVRLFKNLLAVKKSITTIQD